MSSQNFVDSTNGCLEAFRKLLSSPVLGDETTQKQLARFNYWAANIGVFAPPRASLDTRLSHKNSTNYRRLLFQLLDVLERNLHAAANAAAIDADVDNANETSYQDTIQAVGDIISSLHRLSATIRRSAARDRNSKAANFVERDDEGQDINAVFQENVTRIIQHRYPDASKAVCERLGESISLRRRRVLYSKRHQVKLAVKPQVPAPAQQSLPFVVPDIVPQPLPVTPDHTPIPEPLPEPAHIAMSVRPSETAASIPASDTQGSTIASSRASSASTGSMIQDQNLKYPPAPKFDIQTGEASCPYCAAVLSKDEAANTKFWRRHLKRDIEPFVCVAESCNRQVRFFDNFKIWLKHIQQEHRMQWHCTMATHRPIVFLEREEFETHMLTEHKGKVNQSQLATLARRGSRPATHAFDECPLCKAQNEDINGEEQFSKDFVINDRLPRHVAGHLKTLALMFLPPGDNPQEDGTDDPGSSSINRSSRSVDSDSIFKSSLTFGDDVYSREDHNGDHNDDEWIFLPRKSFDGPDQDLILENFVLRQLEIDKEFTRSSSHHIVSNLDIIIHFVDFGMKLISSDGPPERLAKITSLGGTPDSDISYLEDVPKQLEMWGEELRKLNKSERETSSTSKHDQFLVDVSAQYVRLSTDLLPWAVNGFSADKDNPTLDWDLLRKAYQGRWGWPEHPEMDKFESRLLNLRDTVLAYYSLHNETLSGQKSKLPDYVVYQKILDSLRFSTMTDRYEQIPKPHQNTLEWIYSDITPWSNFAEWLRSGSGIYWINGKAASGKSTLMKFIVENPKTEQGLHVWNRAETQTHLQNFQGREGRIKTDRLITIGDMSIVPETTRQKTIEASKTPRDRIYTRDDNGSDEEDSAPGILTVNVLSSRIDSDKHQVANEARCIIDTGNMLGNIVSRDFVQNILQFTESDFRPLSEKEKIGGSNFTGQKFIPDGVIYLTWYHKQSTKVFRDMRFLISPNSHFDLIIGAHSTQKHNLLDLPKLTTKKESTAFAASHFFWRSGTTLQRSESGMLRSLLLQILDVDPSLIPKVLPEKRDEALASPSYPYNMRDWELHELRQAFQKLLKLASKQFRLCFFIDGLDECDEFLIEGTEYLQTQNTFVKFCIASRPLNVLRDAFRDCASLKLQDLTAHDIQYYVDSNLRKNDTLMEIHPRRVDALIQSIVAKANGVFLWVYLVVGSILEGVYDGEALGDLEKRVDHTPLEMNHLSSQMLSSVSSFYKNEFAKILQIFRSMVEPRDAELMYYALRADRKRSTLSIVVDHDEFDEIIDQLSRILQSRTAGLIEIHFEDGLFHSPWKKATLSYIHHTVRDPVERFCEFDLPDFNANEALLIASVLCLDHDYQSRWNVMDYIHDRWQDACQFAKRMNNASLSYTELTWAFDKSATTMASRFNDRRADTGLHWSNSRLPKEWQTNFLCALAEAHLWLPLRKKLIEDPSFVLARRPKQPPLLAFTFLFPGRQIFMIEMSSLWNTLTVLFEFGANPNDVFGGHSMWQYLIHMLHTVAPLRETIQENYLKDIFRLFLDAGADPYVECMPGFETDWAAEMWAHSSYIHGTQTLFGDMSLAGISLRELAAHHGDNAFSRHSRTHGLEAVVQDLFDEMYVEVEPTDLLNLIAARRQIKDNEGASEESSQSNNPSSLSLATHLSEPHLPEPSQKKEKKSIWGRLRDSVR